jgi:hypothetical protein
MVKLIINADDFGYSFGVNYGIIDSHVHGIVNSATIMMNMPGASHAVKLAKQHPSLKIGVHLVLTCGKPLLPDVKSLVDHHGYFKTLSQLKMGNDIDLYDLEREWTAQIEALYQTGLIPNHMDSHHHVHRMKAFYPVVKKLSDKFNLPVRKVGGLTDLAFYSDLFFDDFYGNGVTDKYFEELPSRIGDAQIIEVMVHPGYVDQPLLMGSSYNLQRIEETHILTDTTLPKIFELM